MLLLLGELLEAVGLGGSVVIAATVLFGIWHLRSGVRTASAAGSSLLVAGYAIAILFVVSLFIPGLELDVALGQLAGFLWSLVDVALSLVEAVL